MLTQQYTSRQHITRIGALALVAFVWLLCQTIAAQPNRVRLVSPVQRCLQTNGAALGAKSASVPFELFGSAGLTVIGPLVGPGRDAAHLGFWVPLTIVASVPRNDHPYQDAVAGTPIWAWPNPFANNIQISVEESDVVEASIDVCTVDGIVIGAMRLLQLRSDGCLFQWNGRTLEGNDVSSGSYIARIRLRMRGRPNVAAYTASITCVR